MATFELTGAPNFSADLQSRVQGTLTAEGPRVLDWSYGVDYTKEWIVKLDGQELGKYRTYGPKPDETEFARSYEGIIPGYVNDCIAAMNQDRPESERKPENLVSLFYGNKKFVARLFHEGPGLLVNTLWQRQDGNDEIQFP